MNSELNDVKHSCILEERVKELENIVETYKLKDYKMEILSIVLKPKMFLALCLGTSVIVQVLKGG